MTIKFQSQSNRYYMLREYVKLKYSMLIKCEVGYSYILGDSSKHFPELECNKHNILE